MDVTIEDATAVYDYYLDHQQSVPRAKLMYGILAKRYRPEVTYLPGAKQALRAAVRSRRPFVIAANHTRETDPFILAASGFLSSLRREVGHIRVLAKDELFEDPEQRRKIDQLGGIPVFRSKNHGPRVALAAGQRMIDICATRMARGDSMAVFPEGTCNAVDVTQLQKLGSGIGHIATRAAKQGAQPWLLSIAIVYRDGEKTARRPLVVIGNPVSMSDANLKTPAAVTRFIDTDLQAALDHGMATAGSVSERA